MNRKLIESNSIWTNVNTKTFELLLRGSQRLAPDAGRPINRMCWPLPVWAALLLATVLSPIGYAAQFSELAEYEHLVSSRLAELQASPEDALAKPAAGIGEFLDAEGRLALQEGFIGSLDPAGFEMKLGEDGSPRFVPKGGSADPDARWDDQFFLGSGCDGSVFAVAQGPDGELYLGGNFVSCGDVVAHRVVRFNTATGTWHALGSGGGGNGVDGTVFALAVSDGDVYVGGVFWQANLGGTSVAANSVARFNTATGTWHALGSGGGNGVGGNVYSLAVSGSDLYVGGNFFVVNVGAAVSASRLARFNTATGTWHPLDGGGSSGTGGSVHALAVHGDDLYVGGAFFDVFGPGGGEMRNIARFDTVAGTWYALGSGGGKGVNASVRALVVSGSDLYVGGGFTEANLGGPAVAANRVARFDLVNSTWHALGSSGGNGVNNTVFALAVSDSQLYVAGEFSLGNVGSPAVAANRVARFNTATSTWHALGNGGGNGMDEDVWALAVSGSGLYAGGSFTEANVGGATVATNSVARFNTITGSWHALGSSGGNGLNAPVWALAIAGGDLYVGGLFTQANVGGTTVAANRVARFDTATGTWHALGSGTGNGVNDAVDALAVSGSNLYVGGWFTQANVGGTTVAANRVARFDTLNSTWHALGSGGGNGVDGVVYALAVSGSDLYVGGSFTEANIGGATVAANHVARFDTDGGTWHALGSSGGNGVNSRIDALAVSGSDLYLGGWFTQANVGGATVAANHVARFDTLNSTWHALGSGSDNGVSDTVLALAVSGSDLYVGGSFTEANIGGATVAANHVARFDTDGGTWHALGSSGGNGVNSTVWALAVSGSNLYVGGDFSQANVGGTVVAASRLARFDTISGNWTALGSGTTLGLHSGYSVRSLALSDPDNLYVGGDFRIAGKKPSVHIGRYIARGTLTASVSGSGSGGVISSPSGLACPGACSAKFAWDQPITLFATPSAGSQFVGWSGSGCSGTDSCVIDFDQDTAVEAQFELTYTIGGTVTGLAGSGLVLRNNASDDLPIAANDSFTFQTELLDGSSYAVSVLTQPTNLSQTCAVTAGAGTLAGANVTNVEVNCTTNSFTIGGTVSGLSGSGLVLQNNAGDDLPVASDGSFTFQTALLDGSSYAIGVLTQPTNLSQTCTVTAGAGTLAGANVTNVEVNCTTNSFTIGGTVGGLSGSGLVLQNNAGDDLPIASDGSFDFQTALPDGSSYAVGVLTQPTNLSQTCTVSNGTGTLAGANVTTVEVVCVSNNYTIGGTVSGLVGSGLVLQNNGSDDLSISADGSFTFPTAFPDGSSYAVTVFTQPSNPSQTCIITNGEGNLAGTDVNDVEVICTTDTYVVTTIATNGSITSAIDPQVEHGQSTTVTGEADPNHYFASMSGCGGTPQSKSDQSVADFSYETGPITSACTVEAVFAIRTYTISASVQGAGTVNVLTPIVNHGDDAEFEVTPDTGWSLRSFVGDACTPADNGDGTWTATNVIADCSAEAVFVENTSTFLPAGSPAVVGEPITYTITVIGSASAPADGQVTLSSDIDGLICTIGSADSSSGNAATFSCQHTWPASGTHVLTAGFSGSDTHVDSNDSLQQFILADEFIFRDRFEEQ